MSVADEVRVSDAGFREREVLRSVWQRVTRWRALYSMNEFERVSRYDSSRDALILPDGTHVSVAVANNPARDADEATEVIASVLEQLKDLGDLSRDSQRLVLMVLIGDLEARREALDAKKEG